MVRSESYTRRDSRKVHLFLTYRNNIVEAWRVLLSLQTSRLFFFLSHWLSIEVVKIPFLGLEQIASRKRACWLSVVLWRHRWNIVIRLYWEHELNKLLQFIFIFKETSAVELERFHFGVWTQSTYWKSEDHSVQEIKFLYGIWSWAFRSWGA